MATGDVTLNGSIILQVDNFAWPAASVPTGLHPAASGTIIEVNPTVQTRGRRLLLRGTERTGWYTLSDSVKTSIESLYQTATPFSANDWRGNGASVLFAQPPTFEEVEAEGYYVFELDLITVV